MAQNNSAGTKKHIFYFDALRAFAIIIVLVFHLYTACNSLVVNQYAAMPSLNWWVTDFIAAGCRFGVDLFIMMSGALLLGRATDVKTFLTKRVTRITIPFVFWVIVLVVVSVCVSMMIPQVWHTVDSFTLIEFVKYVYHCFMCEPSGFTHLWFFWMILGLYLIAPVFNKWILGSDLTEIEYFLIIWIITCIFEYTLNYPLRIRLSYFSGPIGMFVLGYYLRYTERKIFNNPRLAIAALIAVILISMFSSYMLSNTHKMVYFENYSIFNVIEVIAIFTLFKNFNKLNLNFNFIKNPDSLFHKSVVSIAKYSYGIYLIHRLILAILAKLLKNQVPYLLLLVILFIVTLALSWGLLAILNRVPHLNKVII